MVQGLGTRVGDLDEATGLRSAQLWQWRPLQGIKKSAGETREGTWRYVDGNKRQIYLGIGIL